MIAVIDYGVGNLFSLCRSLEAIGQQPVVTGDPALLRQADKAGPHASAHYMPAHHHQHACALFARRAHALRQQGYGVVVVFRFFLRVYHYAQIKVVHALAQGQKPQARAVKLFERHVTVPPFQTKMPPAHPDGGSRE